jgi:hypothetical protein
MKEYRVDTEITLVIPIYVEANNIKDAKEKAIAEGYESHHYGECVRRVKADTVEKF